MVQKLTLLMSLILSTMCAHQKAQTTVANPSLQFEAQRKTHEATGTKFVVASQGEATTAVANEIMKAGGNLIDAFAAASFAISVERPHSTGLGGGGFLLYRDGKSKKTYGFDFREKAPKLATKNMYLDAKGEIIADKSTYGGPAIGVPGMVKGVLAIHARFGKLSRAEILRPAIRIAEQGFAIYPELATSIAEDANALKRDPQAKALFFDLAGQPLKAGVVLKQPALGQALRLISKAGPAAFYRGPIAKALVDHQKKIGGLVNQADLNAYELKERPPVMADFLDTRVYSMPPPSSGGVHVVQILKLIELLALNRDTPYATENVNYTAQAMQRAFYDRSKYLGDSDFVEVPSKGLTAQAYNQQIAQSILKQEKLPKPADLKNPDPFAYESTQTTHFSMMDASGNVVSTTQTINGHFGAQVMVPGYGIFLNNEMDDFSAKPGALNMYGAVGSSANEIIPGKRPLSSMSPTIVERAGLPILALGSPSGTRIITCVAMIIANRLFYKMDLYAAESALRYHQQYSPDEIRFEAPGPSKKLRHDLEKVGHRVTEKDLGCRVEAVERDGNILRAVADPRGQGLAFGQ